MQSYHHQSWAAHWSCLQAKAALEKTKQQLEEAHHELSGEVKQLSTARGEAERKRKQAEQQLSELTIRVAELEKGKNDHTDKAQKLQVVNLTLYFIPCISRFIST